MFFWTQSFEDHAKRRATLIKNNPAEAAEAYKRAIAALTNAILEA